MKITISLVTYNGEKFLPACLESIKKQTYKDFDLIVLDNNSNDNTKKILNVVASSTSPVIASEAKRHPERSRGISHLTKKMRFLDFARNDRVYFIFKDKNIGFAAGHNEIIKQAKGEYILVLNQDVILEPNYFEKCVEFLDSSPKAAAVSGRLMKDKNTIDSLGLKIFKSGRVVDISQNKSYSSSEERSGESISEVFGVSAAAVLYRKRALQDVAHNLTKAEFFDEDFFSYKEDIDLAFRLRWHGWQSFVLPQIIAWHARGVGDSPELSDKAAAKNWRKKPQFINYLSYRNHLFVLLKNLSWSFFLRFLPLIFWYELKKFIYLLFVKPKILLAWFSFLKLLPKMLKKHAQIIKSRRIKSGEIKQWFE